MLRRPEIEEWLLQNGHSLVSVEMVMDRVAEFDEHASQEARVVDSELGDFDLPEAM